MAIGGSAIPVRSLGYRISIATQLLDSEQRGAGLGDSHLEQTRSMRGLDQGMSRSSMGLHAWLRLGHDLCQTWLRLVQFRGWGRTDAAVGCGCCCGMLGDLGWAWRGAMLGPRMVPCGPRATLTAVVGWMVVLYQLCSFMGWLVVRRLDGLRLGTNSV
jgi:hypothetical protein